MVTDRAVEVMAGLLRDQPVSSVAKFNLAGGTITLMECKTLRGMDWRLAQSPTPGPTPPHPLREV